MSTLSDLGEDYKREYLDIEHCAAHGIASRPGRSFVADFVAIQRCFRQWKKETLASFAGVSLSTVERVERGESVSKECLDKISVALGFGNGAFTELRVPLRPDETTALWEQCLRPFEGKSWVDVELIRKQRQIASFADCPVSLICSERLDVDVSRMIDELREWLAFASFECSDVSRRSERDRRKVKRRELYRSVLEKIHSIEFAADALALGCGYEAETDVPSLPRVKVAMVAFMPKKNDPALMKRRRLLAPRRIELIPEIMNWGASDRRANV